MKSRGFGNPNQLGRHLGYKNSEKISRLFRNTRHKPSHGILRDLCLNFPDLSISWLLTGRGTMLRNVAYHAADESKQKYIPLYAQFVSSGEKSEEITLLFGKPVDFIPNKFVLKDVDIATYVYGNSMSPQYIPGDVLFLKNLENYTHIHYGHLYVVITPDYQVLRYVARSGKRTWRLRACNEHYEDLEVPKDRVLALYKVQGFFRKLDM